jgi:hypothetical protein
MTLLDLLDKHDPDSKGDVYPYDLPLIAPTRLAGTAMGILLGAGQTMTRSMCGETVSLFSRYDKRTSTRIDGGSR